MRNELNPVVKADITEKMKEVGASSYCLSALLDVIHTRYGETANIKILSIQKHGRINFICFKESIDSICIIAIDDKSTVDMMEWREAKVQSTELEILNNINLKDLFFSTLDVGTVEDRLYSIINNRRYVYEEFMPTRNIIEFQDKILDNVKNDIVAAVGEYYGITIIKSFSVLDKDFGQIYFIKGDTIKKIPLIGDRVIEIDELKNRAGNLLDIWFNNTIDPDEIRYLEYVLNNFLKNELIIKRDEFGIYLKFSDDSGLVYCYNIGDQYCTEFDTHIGNVYRHALYINESKTSANKNAYALMQFIDKYSSKCSTISFSVKIDINTLKDDLYKYLY